MPPRYPSLFQVNSRTWITELSRALGRGATLDDIPDAELNRFAAAGFDWIWMLSVWQTGPAGRQVSRSNVEWRKEFQETLPDLQDEDIGGSGFAITDYSVSQCLGGNPALARLRARMREQGLRLMLDFVPNHTGLDHVYVDTHPEYYVAGTHADLERAPQNYTTIKSGGVDRILAHGRDRYFPGWPDTLQLDYSNPSTQDSMIAELLKIAGQCDGVRCDMAMLILPDVFEQTWGRRPDSFWPRATQCVRDRVPGFCFMAEAYWDLEWTLQQQGFNYAYDKRLYDRLREGRARPVRDHLRAGLDYQDKLVRFLENHDEPRAASTFPLNVHKAAVIVTYMSPGLRFFHQGQLDGRKKRISPHLVRAPREPVNSGLRDFYYRFLSILRLPLLRDGQWRLSDCAPAWEGNWTSDNFLAFSWQGSGGEHLLVTVNYADTDSQCYVRLPFPEFFGRQVEFRDLMGSARYDRAGNDMISRGLYLDLQPWGYHVFEVKIV
jgi:glycosidase